MSELNPSSRPPEGRDMTIRLKLAALKAHVERSTQYGAEQRIALHEALGKISTLPQMEAQKIENALNALGEIARAEPAQVTAAITAITAAMRHGEDARVPEFMKNSQQYFTQAKTVMEQLKSQCAALGFSTLKMLASFLAEIPYLGRIFDGLKNDESVQVQYVLQTYGEKIEGGTTEEKMQEATKIVKVLQPHIEAMNDEYATDSKPQSFDIEEMMKKLVRHADVKNKSLSEKLCDDTAEKIVKADIAAMERRRAPTVASAPVHSPASATTTPPASAPTPAPTPVAPVAPSTTTSPPPQKA